MADATFVLYGPVLKAKLESEDGPVAKKLLVIAQQVEGSAKQYCPVDTGRLRSSITSGLAAEGGELAGVVGTDVEYAAPVEFGTIHMGAQSFLRRALDEVLRSL